MANDASKENIIDRGLTIAQKYFRIKNHYVRELLAEFFGTCFLVCVGESANATQKLSHGTVSDIMSTNLTWGFAVFFAITMGTPVSGGLFNPAITFTWALLGRLSWKKVIPYILVEIFGAFIGAAIVLVVYYEGINAFDGGVRQIDGPNGTAGIFATYPSPHISTFGAFFDQIIGTSGLVIAVMTVTDPINGVPKYLVPFAVAFFVTLSGAAFSYNAGGAMNPARDLGPRILTALAGWGPGVFSYRNYWFWIPTFCPLLGGVLGAAVYNGFIGIHHDRKESTAVAPTMPSVSQLQGTFSSNPCVSCISVSQQSVDLLGLLRKTDSIQPLIIRP